VVGVLGVIDDVTTRTPIGFAQPGQAVWLLGTTRDELAGSAWAGVVHDHLGGLPPVVDLAHEQRLATIMVTAAREGLLTSAHDLSDGGLAQSLVESCLRQGFGVDVAVPDGTDPFVFLFSESTGRVVVSLPFEAEPRLTELAQGASVRLARLGVVTAGGDDASVTLSGEFVLSLSEIRSAWHARMPAALAH